MSQPEPRIEVERSDVEQFLSRFTVKVRDGGSTSEHVVTLSRVDYERLGRHYRSPEELIRASFEFILAREPKEEILDSFDISQIKAYYPEFERTIDGPQD